MAEADYLRTKVQRDGLVCVLTVSGELDLLTVPGFTESAAAALETPAERFVLDLSGLTFTDCRGASALAATAQAVPAGRPVIVRPVNPAVRRMLDLVGMNLESRALALGGRVRQRQLESQRLLSWVWQTRQRSSQLAETVANTGERVADTLIRLAGRSPQQAERLTALSQLARLRAAQFRSQAASAQCPAAAGSLAAHRTCPACGTDLA